MENLIIYLLKASGLVAVFYTAYYTLLRKETFFTSNRSFLLAGLVTSAVMPLLVLTHTVWIEATEKVQVQLTPEELQQYLQMQQMAALQSEPEPINWYNIAGYIYVAVAVFFLFRFLYQLYLVRKMLKGEKIIKQNGFKYIDSETVQSPFSFFSYIVYNSKLLTDNELENVLSHEKVHSRQKHSADMIISNLFCILLWFNPFIWFYKKAVAQNLEFIADAEAIKQIADTKAYQKTLLKITVQPECTAIINHFYQSLIKKRIVMLNKKQSKTRNSWKYAAVLPVLIAFMVLFQLEVRAQQTEATEKSVYIESTKVALEVNKDSKDEALEAEKSFFKSEYNVDVNFSAINRNDKGEITAIKVTINDGTDESVYQVKGSKPIKAFTVELTTDNNGNVKTGFGVAQGLKISAGSIDVNNTDEDTLFLNRQDVLKDRNAIRNRQGFGETAVQQPAAGDGHWTLSSWKFGDKDALVIINGVKQEKGEPIKISLDEELSEVKVLTAKEAKKKYGKEGKNGAMEVTTKKEQRGRFTTHTFTETLPAGTKVYIGNEGLDYDVIMAEVARMRELANVDFAVSEFVLADRLKALGELTPEEVKAIREQLEEAQEAVRKLGSGNYETLRFSTEEFEEARQAMEEARAALEEKRNELETNRRMLNEKIQEEHKKQAEEKRKAAEERRKEAEKQRKI
ncbi:M56 family metallopeptidase [Flavobacterium sp.]|uniref:M56 family metallopeptidase n=1 Tax=Flavobacterium sp. TaxID=239 RepID=UPI002606DFA5|nr:M56 family metallopeptidase [Flavobacterium sp.]